MLAGTALKSCEWLRRELMTNVAVIEYIRERRIRMVRINFYFNDHG